jgi:two-component system sensor histidine kinase TctE
VPPRPEPEESIQHSLFGEILDWMLAPLLLLWPMSIAITYLVAKSIANQPFDHALEDSVTVLAQQVKEVDGKVARACPAARATSCAPTTSTASTSRSPGRAASCRRRPRPAAAATPTTPSAAGGALPQRQPARHAGARRLCLGQPAAAPPAQAAEPRLALVQVAETLEKRAQLANEIIKGVILPQFIILP